MPDVDRPCREHAEVIVTAGRYDHVARGYLDSHMDKRPPGESRGNVPGSREHHPGNPDQDFTVCITHHDERAFFIEH